MCSRTCSSQERRAGPLACPPAFSGNLPDHLQADFGSLFLRSLIAQGHMPKGVPPAVSRGSVYRTLSPLEDPQIQDSLLASTLNNTPTTQISPPFPPVLYPELLPQLLALGLAGIPGKCPWLSAPLPCQAGPVCRV